MVHHVCWSAGDWLGEVRFWSSMILRNGCRLDKRRFYIMGIGIFSVSTATKLHQCLCSCLNFKDLRIFVKKESHSLAMIQNSSLTVIECHWSFCAYHTVHQICLFHCKGPTPATAFAPFRCTNCSFSCLAFKGYLSSCIETYLG